MSITTGLRTYRVVATLQERYINCQGAETVEELVSILEDHSQGIELEITRKPSQGVIEQELAKMGFDFDDYDLVDWYEVVPNLNNYDEF